MNTEKNDIKRPGGELCIRTLAMPADANPSGDIFGGWIVSHMDLAGLSIASKFCKCRVTTVAIDAMKFINPVQVGEFICCYGEIVKVGNTSVRIKVETWAIGTENQRRQVTEGIFTFVAIDERGRPIIADPKNR